MVAEIVEDAIFDERHHVLRVALISRELHLRIKILKRFQHSVFSMLIFQTNQVLGHVDVGSLIRSSNVVNKPNFRLEENDFEGSSDVFYIEEVPLV